MPMATADPSATRAAAIARASACADGPFAKDLARLVAMPTESQAPAGPPPSCAI